MFGTVAHADLPFSLEKYFKLATVDAHTHTHINRCRSKHLKSLNYCLWNHFFQWLKNEDMPTETSTFLAPHSKEPKKLIYHCEEHKHFCSKQMWMFDSCLYISGYFFVLSRQHGYGQSAHTSDNRQDVAGETELKWIKTVVCWLLFGQEEHFETYTLKYTHIHQVFMIQHPFRDPH